MESSQGDAARNPQRATVPFLGKNAAKGSKPEQASTEEGAEPTLAPPKAGGPLGSDRSDASVPPTDLPRAALPKSDASADTTPAATITGPTLTTPALSGPTIDDPRPSAGDESPVFARPSPVLAVETIGPRKIPVGKESNYEITVKNSGQVAAEQVMVTIDVAPWAHVAGAEPSVGSAAPDRATDSPNVFRWKLGRLESKGHERLVLRIVPRESRPFDLVVKWDCTPSTSQSKIEVQEPKLAVALHGPRNVLLGKGEIFKLEVSNTGSGDAENVTLMLTPGDKQAPVTQQLGTIAVGQKKSIDVELTGRQAGKLVLVMEARAASGAKTKLSEEIDVRRAAFAIEVEAPKVQYVGTETAYRIRVSNTGTAAAARVAVTATLPAKAKYINCTQDGKLSSDGTKVAWTLSDLAPGTDITLGLTCVANSSGTNRLEVQCAAEGNVAATASASTQIEAMANLVLTVDDPQGPVPMDSTASYQFSVENRGTAPAESVEMVVYFSDGYEPVSAEGGRNRLAPGQVVFELLPSIAPNQTVTFKVRAKAERPGNHVFRVEVVSKAAGTRVVREGTTRFFGETASPRAVVQPESALSPAERTASGPDRSTGKTK